MNKRVGGGMVLVIALLFLGWLFSRRSSPAISTGSRPSAETEGAVRRSLEMSDHSTAPTKTSTTAPTRPSEHRVKRITPDERHRVALQIEAAQKARTASRLTHVRDNTAASADKGDVMATAQDVLGHLQEVVDDVRGYVAECARYAPGLERFTTQITLTGDPDIGTLIDAPTPALGSDGEQVPAAFDNCIRGQLQTLELPPMRTGDKFTVDYEIAL